MAFYIASQRRKPMRARRTFVVSLIFLALLALPAWAGQALLVQGQVCQKAGQHQQAVELFRKYVKRYPQIAEGRRLLAVSLAELGRTEEALKELNLGLARDPQDLALLLAKGSLLARLEQRPEAIGVYSQVINLDPNNAEAYKERGENKSQEGQFEEAIADFNRAAALAPQDPWVYNKRGMAWFCQGDYRQAVADFSTAIKLRPDLAISYFFRGNIYRHHLGEPEKAKADYREGCRLGQPLCCKELEKLEGKP
jgi:tetratricopeptide (TPR) repeat protein